MCTISIHIVRRCKLVSARQCGSSIIFWMAYKKIVYGFSDCFPIFGGDLWSVNVFTAFFTTKQIFWQATDRNWQAAEQWANMLYGQTEKNPTNDMMWEMVPAVKRSTFQTSRHAGSVVQSYCLFLLSWPELLPHFPTMAERNEKCGLRTRERPFFCADQRLWPANIDKLKAG